MGTFTFNLAVDQADGQSYRLTPCDPVEITTAMWELLAGDIAREPTLMSSSAAMLASRHHAGYAALAIHESRIISFIALLPVIHSTAGAPSWAKLTAGLDLHGADLPSASVFLFTNSWTAPAWRRRGISLALRPCLVDRYLVSDNVGILGMDGLASPVPAQLGWRIVAWKRVPFISSLMTLSVKEFPEQAEQAWISTLNLKLYQGPHVPLDATDHPWKEYLHFWVSDEARVEKLEQQIQAIFCGDLHRWRSILLMEFSDPEILWKIPFDNCEG